MILAKPGFPPKKRKPRLVGFMRESLNCSICTGNLVQKMGWGGGPIATYTRLVTIAQAEEHGIVGVTGQAEEVVVEIGRALKRRVRVFGLIAHGFSCSVDVGGIRFMLGEEDVLCVAWLTVTHASRQTGRQTGRVAAGLVVSTSVIAAYQSSRRYHNPTRIHISHTTIYTAGIETTTVTHGEARQDNATCICFWGSFFSVNVDL